MWTGDDAFSAIDFPGAFYTEAWDINNRGEIVGSFWDTADDCDAGVFHGYLRMKEGLLVTIDFSEAVETFLTGITDDGNVAGSYIESGTGNEFGFIALRTAESH